MGQNLFYSELNDEQIFFEIIKRFADFKYSENYLSVKDIFGYEWSSLDKEAKRTAERWFRKGITDKVIKGIIYIREDDGMFLYKRIPNDKYQME